MTGSDTPNTHTASDAGLSEADLDRLEKLAKAATPGGWDLEDPMAPHSYAIVETGKPTHEWRFIATLGLPDEDDHDFTAREVTANGKFIAAFDPPTALKLLAIARRRLAGGAGTGAAGLTAEELLAVRKLTALAYNASEAHGHIPLSVYRDNLRILLRVAARAQAATAPAGEGATFEALRKIKLVALTAGAPGELPVPQAFARIIRLCIDAGVAEKLPDLRAAASQGCDRPPEGWTCSRTPGHDGPCAASPTPDAPAKPGPGGEGVKRVRDWIERVISEDRQRNEMLAALDAALAAAPADAALRSALEAIKGGHFWHGAFDQLQAIARAALTTASPADGAPEVEG